MKKMFVGNLPFDATEDSVQAMFSTYGTVRSLKLVADVFSGRCKGFAFVEMEGHEARAAIAGLDGKTLGDRALRVTFEDPRGNRGRGRR
jgi:RNA recognition motif-containing protein